MTEAEKKALALVKAAPLYCELERGCWVGVELLFHLLGGSRAGYHPEVLTHEGWDHWFLRTPSSAVLDPSVDQFATTPDYSQGTQRGGSSPATLSMSARSEAVLRADEPLRRAYRQQLRREWEARQKARRSLDSE